MIKTVNPYNSEAIETYKLHTPRELEKILENAEATFLEWKQQPIVHRTDMLDNLADNLVKHKNDYAKLMTKEMGKPITESIAEIEKCILLCDFYSTNAESLLSDDLIETEAEESFISYDPLGTILGIMPWNYPFWQVLRFAVPTITAGNTVLLKHASNVTGCALILQELFESSGYPDACFQTILVEHDPIETLIEDQRVKAVSLTGSEKAGRKIAEISGKHLKKTVLELGGNNACMILNDADLDTHINTIVNARMQNSGQSCIAAKRFIVVEDIYDEFLEKFTSKIKTLKSGDPSDKQTDIGVLARLDLADTLQKQIEASVSKGAKIHFGNKRNNTYYQPTILTEVRPGMAVFDDETFGPVASVIKVKDTDEAYKMTSISRYGLGTMIFTRDTDAARTQISEIEDGAFFINELVKSDPRLPFGGTKASGYGRELSREGILEFVNKKTVYINK
ncbi:NAD-dependent succinate-semialdehyde dehydrogenase [Psychroserpens mesophilus]|uniref:NAD-dependent succinate-semialdehyde dehydrogenase n=1 Tax=Psychroserpens mesophilus TaxID=325473 RepID=UPI0005909AFF|nr:NAD-dependent succinate-semialdehyde dehydrogenase [Psychroserpens mesophilus]